MTRPAMRSPDQGVRRVWAFVVAVGALCVVATWPLLEAGTSTLLAESERVVILAVAFAAVERWALTIRLRDRDQSLTLSELPLLIGVFAVSPISLLVARLVGVLPSLFRDYMDAPFKRAYNLMYQWAETLVVVAVVTAIAPDSPLDNPRAVLAAVAVFAIAIAMGTIGLTTVLSIHRGRWQSDALPAILRQTLAPGLATTAFGMVVVSAYATSPWLIWAPVVLLGVLYQAYRSHNALIQLNDRQTGLLDFTRRTSGRDGLRATAEEAVAEVRRLPGITGALIVQWLATGDRLRLAAWGDVDALHRTTDDPVSFPSEDHEGPFITSSDDPTVFVWPLSPDHQLALAVQMARARPPEELTLPVDHIANHTAVAIANAQHLGKLRSEADRAARRALQDPLTGLHNRTAILDAIDRAIDVDAPFAVLLMDLDDFKRINDALGHAAGDEMLRAIAARLTSLAGDRVEVARLGGDEFALLVPGDARTATEVAQRIIGVIGAPVTIEPYELQVRGSIGISLFPEHSRDAAKLLQDADLAMYEAKSGTGSVSVFGVAAAGRAVRQLAVSTRLRTALDRGDVTAVYQPQIDLRTGATIGVEALARWTDEELGVVRPDEFVPVAEHSGLIVPLTTHMLDDALGWYRRWQAAGLDLQVSVNLSTRSLLDSRLPERIETALATHDAPASRLTLEITESSVIEDPQRTTEVLANLAAMGVRLSIDDFGTGYSSLAYLQQLPVDEVKIDKSFVLPMANDRRPNPLIAGIIRLCHDLELDLVAEGIETATVERQLRRMECDTGQGFGIAKPMSPEEIEPWVLSRSAPDPATGPAGAAGSAAEIDRAMLS